MDSTDFPIAESMSSVMLELEPKALRELHWHTSADEWHYVLHAKVEISLFGPNNRWPHPDPKTKSIWAQPTVDQGRVAYIPMGFAHSIENVGTDTARVLSVMNCGSYRAIGLSSWLASNPDYLLKEHLGTDANLTNLPTREVFITKGEGR